VRPVGVLDAIRTRSAHLLKVAPPAVGLRGPVKPVLTICHMPDLHIYLSTACQHESIDSNPRLHAACRQTCKFCGASCACPAHPDATSPALTWVDQARDIARDLWAWAAASPVPMPAELLLRIESDPALFWLRDGEQPAGQWQPGPGSSPGHN
jgi:hypothetical protein